ncbi:MAG: hypothetical protein ABSF35_18370 [Polyangia bacterium]|jgi:hypothetical protein
MASTPARHPGWHHDPGDQVGSEDMTWQIKSTGNMTWEVKAGWPLGER